MPVQGDARLPVLQKWEQFNTLFPTGLSGQVPLYRLMTIPIKYADMKVFHIEKPCPAPVGSWAKTRTGIMYVAGIATDMADRLGLEEETARLSIKANIDAQNILATTQTIRYAIIDMTRDYMNIDHWEIGAGKDKAYLDYQGDYFDKDSWSMEVDYMRERMQSLRGGHYNQWEYIVRTQPVDATVDKVFRVGLQTKIDGWEF